MPDPSSETMSLSNPEPPPKPASPFATHTIRSEVTADGFRSWLLMRPHADGGWSSTFWCRVTAADGLLRVDGDFQPTIFAHGPHDPVSCVYWMGSHTDLDHYVMEKASIGTGRDRITTYDEDLAKADLREIIASEERDAGRQPSVGEQRQIDALKAGLEVDSGFNGRYAVHAIITAIVDEARDWDILELVGSIGKRPDHSVEFALQALNRLVAILDSEQVAEPIDTRPESGLRFEVPPVGVGNLLGQIDGSLLKVVAVAEDGTLTVELVR